MAKLHLRSRATRRSAARVPVRAGGAKARPRVTVATALRARGAQRESRAREEENAVHSAVRRATVAAPTAVLGVAATAAASHAAMLNELTSVATIDNPLLPFIYFGGLFGVLGGTIAVYVFLVKIELI